MSIIPLESLEQFLIFARQRDPECFRLEFARSVVADTRERILDVGQEWSRYFPPAKLVEVYAQVQAMSENVLDAAEEVPESFRRFPHEQAGHQVLPSKHGLVERVAATLVDALDLARESIFRPYYLLEQFKLARSREVEWCCSRDELI